jgi:hypothetical protein
MNFVDHYLLYFRQWLITCPLLDFSSELWSLLQGTPFKTALLPFQPLFTESSHGDQLLAPVPFSGALIASRPLCCVLVFSSLFIQFLVFFFRAGGQSAQGSMLVYPRGGWWNTE